MKTLFTRLLLLGVILLSTLTASAYKAKIDGIYYNFDTSNKTASVTYYVYGSSNSSVYIGNVVIPSNVIYNEETYSVMSIGDRAFNNCTSLASITIPNSVTSIGDEVFYNCYNLQRISVLAEVPPTVSGLKTFACSTDYVREQYDVYNYATLHVPMGTKELYSSAYEWRYFNKIKEDMEIGGNTYYAPLKIQQGTNGYIVQNIKADETYTFNIAANGESKINSILFNGEDVTDQLINGKYTTPQIKSASVLSISYETTTRIESTSLQNVKVKGYNGTLTIDNIDEPSLVAVYTVDGKMIANETNTLGSTTFNVEEGNVYIVRVGERSYKIAM